MGPIVFQPLIHRAIWGGNRLGSLLGKPIGDLTDAAESWEICDLPGNESIVATGLFSGQSIRVLMDSHRDELLGRHAHQKRFPLLFKFLDARQQLSVQVHPIEPTMQGDESVRLGKAEAWIVVDTSADSEMSLGLKAGVTESQLRSAVAEGDVTKFLHVYRPQVGDCILLEPGTVHALGGGIVVAEIQEPSEITYRLYDWARVNSAGDSRPLHTEQALRSIRYDLGPVAPLPPQPVPGRPATERLIESKYFTIHRHNGPDQLTLPDDDLMHVLMVVRGSARLWSQEGTEELSLGATILLPARREAIHYELSDDCQILDSFLPKSFRSK